jgi:drug/metabolite transporter (DMT)-like permease
MSSERASATDALPAAGETDAALPLAPPPPGAATTASGPAFLPYATLLLVMLLWASNVILGRLIAGVWSPFALSVWRWGLALLILLPIAGPALRRHWSVIRRHARLIMLLGLLSVGLFNTLLYVALNYTTAINVALMNSTTPIAILLLSRILIGTRMAPRVIVGVSLGLVGAAIIVTRGDPSTLLQLRFNIGDLIQSVAVLIWALYSVLLQRHPVPLPPLVLQLAMTAVGVPVLCLIFLAMPSHGVELPRHWSDGLMLAYLALGVSLGSTLLWNTSIARVGARVAGFFNYLTPPIVAVLSVLILDEHLRPFHGVGFVLILCGILLATLTRFPLLQR